MAITSESKPEVFAYPNVPSTQRIVTAQLFPRSTSSFRWTAILQGTFRAGLRPCPAQGCWTPTALLLPRPSRVSNRSSQTSTPMSHFEENISYHRLGTFLTSHLILTIVRNSSFYAHYISLPALVSQGHTIDHRKIPRSVTRWNCHTTSPTSIGSRGVLDFLRRHPTLIGFAS